MNDISIYNKNLPKDSKKYINPEDLKTIQEQLFADPKFAMTKIEDLNNISNSNINSLLSAD
jgi:hypothetical protein